MSILSLLLVLAGCDSLAGLVGERSKPAADSAVSRVGIKPTPLESLRICRDYVQDRLGLGLRLDRPA